MDNSVSYEEYYEGFQSLRDICGDSDNTLYESYDFGYDDEDRIEEIQELAEGLSYLPGLSLRAIKEWMEWEGEAGEALDCVLEDEDYSNEGLREAYRKLKDAPQNIIDDLTLPIEIDGRIFPYMEEIIIGGDDECGWMISELKLPQCGCLDILSIEDSFMIRSLPDDFAESCPGLMTLALPNANFKVFPKGIEQLEELDCLCLGGTFTTIPKELVKLENLRELDLSNCHNLESIPEEFEAFAKDEDRDISIVISEKCPAAAKVTELPQALQSIIKIKLRSDGMSYGLTEGKIILTSGKDVAEVEIPQFVESKGKKYPVVEIGDSAFQNCSNVSSVSFPEGLQEIGAGAFEECTNLSSITFPEGLKTIGNSAFYQCSNLSSVTFPEGLQEIGWTAFKKCDNLSSVTFSEGLKTIGESAFSGCSNLSSVTLPEGLQEIGEGAFKECPLSLVTTRETQNIEVLKKELSAYTAFFLSVPTSCQSAYENTCPNAIVITSEKLHSAEIDGMSYDLADGTDVAVFSMWQKSDFAKIVEHAKQYGIVVADFEKATMLKRGEFRLEYLNGFVPGMPNDKVLVYAKAMNRAVLGIANAYMKIHPNASLSDLNKAFPIHLNDANQVDKLFWEANAANEKLNDFGKGYEPFFNKPDELLQLAEGKAILRKGKDVAEVEIPQYIEYEEKKYAVKAIGYEAFRDCSNLSSVTFPEGLKTIGYSAFYECSNVSSVTFPEGLKEIGESAFSECCNLSFVTFPEGLKEIGEWAFKKCCNLSFVTFPEGLKEIGKNAFRECTNLSSVTFHKGLQTIGWNAFCECSNLSSITSYVEDPEVIQSISDSSRTLYVPSHLKEAYDNSANASEWKSIEIIE